MFNLVMMDKAFVTVICLYAAVKSVAMETTTNPMLSTNPMMSSVGCPPQWKFKDSLCYSMDISKEQCLAMQGVDILGLCLKKAVHVAPRPTTQSTKEFNLGVYFKGFKRYCCAHGFGFGRRR